MSVFDLLGIFGLVALLFGVLGGFISGSFAPTIILTHFSVGIIFVTLWFAFSGIRKLALVSQALHGRRARLSVYTAFSLAALFVALISLNIVLHRKNVVWDSTEQRIYSLSIQAKQLLDSQQDPIRVVIFTNVGESRRNNEEALARQVSYERPDILTIDFVDGVRKPELVRKYQVSSERRVFVRVDRDDGEQSFVLPLFSEESFVNGILKLERQTERQLYFIAGHEEPEIKDDSPRGITSLVQMLRSEGLKSSPLFLEQEGEVPEDTLALVLISPQKNLSDFEVRTILEYLDGGGRIVLFGDPGGSPDVKLLAGKNGIFVGDDIIVDVKERLVSGPALHIQPVISRFGQHPVVREFAGKARVVFTIAQSVRSYRANVPGENFTNLVYSSQYSWADSSVDSILNGEFSVLEESDTPGPIPLAAAFERRLGAEKQEELEFGKGDFGKEAKFSLAKRVIVFGDSDFVRNEYINLLSNRDLALNAITWASGQSGGLAIRARGFKPSVAPLTLDVFYTLLSMSFLVPELILLLGILSWWYRRSISLR